MSAGTHLSSDEIKPLAKKNRMWEPKAPVNENIIKLEKPKLPGAHKMDPDELQDSFKANRGTGAHKNPKDKRAKNPKKQDFDY
jgi:hypothetical protein